MNAALRFLDAEEEDLGVGVEFVDGDGERDRPALPGRDRLDTEGGAHGLAHRGIRRAVGGRLEGRAEGEWLDRHPAVWRVPLQVLDQQPLCRSGIHAGGTRRLTTARARPGSPR